MNERIWISGGVVFGLMCCAMATAADWPMWRYDAQRTAASEERLENDLQLLWKLQLGRREPAWDDALNRDLMTYDRIFEPIVKDGRLFLGFNDRDQLVAFDAATGRRLWSCFAGAPVRLPPVAWRDRVYFCSDDGYLYCVDAADGQVVWRFRGGPASRNVIAHGMGAQKVIGNQRLTSAWPARGGPVIRDDTVYFAASIWPFMGVFIYAIDADSGELRWVNDNTGSQYIKQPHSAPSFAGVAPQGALAATEQLLLVPGGRSVPAAFDRDSGDFRYFEINAGGKGTGGSFVAADEKYWYVHTRRKGTRAFELQSGIKTAFMPNEPVLADGMVYSAETSSRGSPVVRAYRPDQKVAWEIAADGRGDLILAGETLYAAGGTGLTAIQLPVAQRPPEIRWSLPVEGQIERLLAAEGKLFAVTLDGQIMAFGSGTPSTKPREPPSPRRLTVTDQGAHGLKRLDDAVPLEGFAFWFGDSSHELVTALADDSPFVQLAIVDRDGQRVDQLRRRLDAAELYGRVTAHHSAPDLFRAPKYVANLVIVAPELAAAAGDDLLARLYESVRPYGGAMLLLAEHNREQIARKLRTMQLEQAQIDTATSGVLVRRAGALPGSGDWTHQYGNIANTIKSNDKRVKMPLGLLWFGGSSNADVLPRHGHGPPEQVIGGRLFIQGINCLSARDVYTGRVLWKRTFEDLGTFDVYFDQTYSDDPLNPAYNQVHIPGANGRGTNYVATEDRVYIVEGSICHVLDPATGRTLRDIRLPADESGKTPEWGFIGVYEDVLLGGVGFANYRQRHGITIEADRRLRRNRAGFGSQSLDRAASVALVGFDRHTGELLWQSVARHSFWHNGIVAGGGRVYCLDKNPQQIEDALRRRGKSLPDSYRIVALKHRTGEPIWEINEGVFGTWLGYSAEHDALLQAGAAASDRLYGEVAQGMAVYGASDGKLRWENKSVKYAGPCILHNDYIITNANSYTDSAGAFRLDNGQQRMVPNPLTGQLQPWKVTRAYGCNNIIASENLLTFRSGAAGFYDLLSDSGTGNFGGFKSGCTSNLVVANGVLNSPDYTRTCSCAYQNQTSLALVHMPDLEWWTVNSAATVDTPGQQIEHLGINFGAPGDRRDETGLLWLEFPAVAGESPPLDIRLDFGSQGEDPPASDNAGNRPSASDQNGGRTTFRQSQDARGSYFQHHASTMPGLPRPWVLASGAEGVTELRIRTRLLGNDLRGGVPVAQAADDAEENENGDVNLGSSDLELVEDHEAQLVGLRFTQLDLPRGAAVRNAYVQFTCDEPSDGRTSLIISAEDTGNADAFRQETHDLSARAMTAEEVAWSPPPWLKSGDVGKAQRTPNLAPVIRAVISRADWQPGNSLVLLISGVGKRVAAAARGRSRSAARLVVELDQVADGAAAPSRQPYRVRLFFGAPGSLATETRVFDVYLQGELVRQRLTLGAGDDHRPAAAVQSFDKVMIGDELHLQLQPHQGRPLLSGVEITRRRD